MGKTIYLFIATGLVILLGTFVMYGVESKYQFKNKNTSYAL